MKADRLEIAEGASVGNMAVVLYDTKMRLGSWLAPLSGLMKGETLPPLSRWYGIPTQQMPDPPRRAAGTAPAIETTECLIAAAAR